MPILRKLSVAALCASVLLGTLAAPVAAQDAPPRKTVELADAKGGGAVVSLVGEVTAIDLANRVVSIKGPKGNVADLRVDARARNLEQVKVGDRVRLTYRVGVALALLKGGDGIREKVESESAARTAAGDKPGAAAIKTTTLVANVEEVNAKRQIVTLKGPGGKVVDVKVRDPKVFKEVKVGDQVAASITESVVLRVRPAS
jgi:hypothetical protein